MAKHAKRRSSKRRSSRRRRIGAVGKLDIQATALGVAGAIIGSKLQAMLSKDPTKTTLVSLSPYAALGAGIALAMLVKNPMAKSLAVGLTIMGGVSALKKLAPGIVGNFAMVPVINNTVNRYRDRLSPVQLNGTPLPRTSVYSNSMNVVNGMPSGANPNGSGAGSAFN
jgi:hypothetical protein